MWRRHAVTPFAECGDSAGVSRAPGLRRPRGSHLTLRITRVGDEFASSETVLQRMAMDSLFCLPVTRGTESGARHSTLAARSATATRKVCLWDRWVDGRRIIDPDSENVSRVVVCDALFDGVRIRSFQPYDVTVRSGQHVRL